MAPELQDTSKSQEAPTPKVDVYSMGVVLFELFYRPLKTGMERTEILGRLSHGAQPLPVSSFLAP